MILRKHFGLSVLTLAMTLAVSGAHAAPPVKKAVPPANTSRGTQQMKGGDGVFGTVYTLDDNSTNFEILSARYSIEPFNSYSMPIATNDQKLLILTVAIKNSGTSDLGFNPEQTTFTAVDDANQNYQGWDYRQASKAGDSFYPTLKPGQGLGQNPAADELSVCITVPAKAKIMKIILNRGRKAVAGEKIVRYFVAGMDNGNPKNVIKPLPAYIHDPKDATGAVCADLGTAAIGAFVPSEYYAYRADAVTASSDAVLNGNKPEDGKKFIIATVTLKNISAKEYGFWEAYNGGGVPYLLDSDGEKYPWMGDAGMRKPTRDEAVNGDRKFKPGEEYAVRYFFQVPKDVKPKSLILGVEGGHNFAVDLSSVAL